MSNSKNKYWDAGFKSGHTGKDQGEPDRCNTAGDQIFTSSSRRREAAQNGRDWDAGKKHGESLR